MCDDKKKCTFDSLMESRDPTELCDKAASYIGTALVSSGTIANGGEAVNLGARDVIGLALNAGNWRVEDFILNTFNELGSVAMRQAVEILPQRELARTA